MTEFKKNEITSVAYLAPEIPALSATFVYNEILALEKQGISVIPISVHQPSTAVIGNTDVESMSKRTHYLYQKSFSHFISSSVRFFLHNPFVYLKTMGNLCLDVIKVGPFTRTGIGLIYRFFASASVADILCQERCKHLHIHFAHIPTDIGMYSAALAGIPFSFTSHANDLFQRNWLLKEKVDRARFCVTISEYNKQFIRQYGAQEESIHVIHCGVDTRAFSSISKRKKTAKEMLVIGTLGRAVEKKGFDILLATVAILKEQGVNLQLLLAADGPLLDELKQDAERLNIAKDVEFCGAIAHKKVASWLQQLDLFVLPCKQDREGDMDGIPVVLMEAMMIGTPVVSTRLTGIPELIIDKTTGMLAEPGDPDSLACAIINIRNDNVLRQRLIQAAAEWVQEQFDLRKNVESLAKLIVGTKK